MRFLVPALTLAAACGSLLAQAPAQPPSDLEAVVATSLGTFRFEFAADKAPKHVEQFIRLARQGYYDGSAFFRVFANGLIQGGDPLLKDPKTPRNLWGTGGLSLIASEFSDMKHDRGVVSTVSIPNKADSDGAQFFVCISPQTALDGKYSAFGKVTEGIHVVEAISRVPVAADQFAENPVRIMKVTIESKKKQPFADTPVSELHRTVTMKTTLGTIKIEMEPEWAPNHVRNFLALTDSGWYNGTLFFRVAKGFVAQGGQDDQRSNPDAERTGERWVHTLKGEFRDDVKHERGIVSMARTDDPDSAATSFFLMLGPAPHLDGRYSAFGKIIEGLDVLDAFEKLEVNGESPVQKVEIISAAVDPK